MQNKNLLPKHPPKILAKLSQSPAKADMEHPAYLKFNPKAILSDGLRFFVMFGGPRAQITKIRQKDDQNSVLEKYAFSRTIVFEFEMLGFSVYCSTCFCLGQEGSEWVENSETDLFVII